MSTSKCFASSSLFAAIAVLCGAVPNSSSAAVVLGNLGSSGTNAIGTANDGTDKFLAYGFTTGTNPLFLDLSSATFGLATTPSAATVTATVRFDNSGVPGAILSSGTIGSPVNVGTSGSTITFSAASPIALGGSQNYWIVLEAGDSNVVNWFSLSGNTFGNATPQNSSGWAQFSGGFQSDTGTSGWEATLQTGAVSITAVPEPGSLVLLASAAIAACGNFLRRRPNVAIVN